MIPVVANLSVLLRRPSLSILLDADYLYRMKRRMS